MRAETAPELMHGQTARVISRSFVANRPERIQLCHTPCLGWDPELIFPDQRSDTADVSSDNSMIDASVWVVLCVQEGV